MVLLHPSVPRTVPFTPCNAKTGLLAPRTRPLSRRQVIHAVALLGHDEKNESKSLDKVLRVTVAGFLASGMLWLSPSPAEADVQMVSPQLVTQMARPLPKQTVEKSKVWSVLIGGAVLLFGSTLLIENNPSFFPAIARANRAMKEAAKMKEEEEQRAKKEAELLQLRQAEYDDEQRRVAAVALGMKEARAKVLGSAPAAAAGAPVEVAAAPVAAAVAAPAAPAAVAESSTHVSAAASAASAPAVAESHSESAAAPASTSSASYLVVEDAVPDMGAVAWPSAAAVASTSASGAEAAVTNGSTAGASAAAAAGSQPEEDAESLARVARLQGFVSDTLASSKSAMEALKSQRP